MVDWAESSSDEDGGSFLVDEGFGGRLMISSCTLVGGCVDRLLMRTPYCTLDRRRFGLRMIGMLVALTGPKALTN